MLLYKICLTLRVKACHNTQKVLALEGVRVGESEKEYHTADDSGIRVGGNSVQSGFGR